MPSIHNSPLGRDFMTSSLVDNSLYSGGGLQVNRTTYWYEEVSSADFHTCAVGEEGELECWGNAFKAEQVPDGFQAA